MHSHFTADTVPQLDSIAKQAFEVLAGMAPELCVADSHRSYSFEVEASVSYDEGQNTRSTLLIKTNARFAIEFSQRFLGLPSLTELDDDVLDAMGELANTVGGNLKGLFSADLVLSTPEVSTGNRPSQLDPANRTVAELTYAFGGGGHCLVTLLGTNEEVSSATLEE